MCLGVPGRVIRWIQRDPLFGQAIVEFNGLQRECSMACVPDAEPGCYVVVHAGIAICRINEEEALRTLTDLASMPDLQQEAARQFGGNSDEEGSDEIS